MRRGAKLVGIPLVVLGLLGAAAIVSVNRWTTRMLEAQRERVRAELPQERARVLAKRQPVLRGTPRDEDAAPAWKALLAATGPLVNGKPGGGESGYITLSKAARHKTPVSDDAVRAILAAHAGTIARFSETARFTRCDWAHDYEGARPYDTVNLIEARTLANLVLVAGHALREAGDVDRAAWLYLEELRFACDLADGPLIQTLISVACCTMGLEALEQLASGQEKFDEKAVLDALAKLEDALPTTVVGYRHERLLMPAGTRLMLGSNEAGTEPGIVHLLPTRTIAVQAVETLDLVLRELERRREVTDPAERERIERFATESARKSWNPIVQQWLGTFDDLEAQVKTLATRHARLRQLLTERRGGR